MRDWSIEYAHIYTKDEIGKEQEVSLEVLSSCKNKFISRGETFSLCVLVDDYSFPDASFNYEEFNNWLSLKGHKPDICMRESELIPLCDIVLKNIHDKKMKWELQSYIDRKKYPCSLFIASWYLLRLGYLEYLGYDKKLIAKRVLSILPVSFKPYEDKALLILSKSGFPGSAKQIEHHYIKGRELV